MRYKNRNLEREIQKKQKTRRRLLINGGITLAILAALAVIFLLVNNPANAGGLMGDAVEIPSRDHVPTNIAPGPFKSNPPAGGAHYGTDFPAKFYQEADLTALPQYPQGYLVHSLEHGYVIFWYNCAIPNTDCDALKRTIQKVMNDTGGAKLIAFPWTDMDVPLAMTSWGRILKFPSPNPEMMKQFVERNRYQAPEPNAP